MSEHSCNSTECPVCPLVKAQVHLKDVLVQIGNTGSRVTQNGKDIADKNIGACLIMWTLLVVKAGKNKIGYIYRFEDEHLSLKCEHIKEFLFNFSVDFK